MTRERELFDASAMDQHTSDRRRDDHLSRMHSVVSDTAESGAKAPLNAVIRIDAIFHISRSGNQVFPVRAVFWGQQVRKRYNS